MHDNKRNYVYFNGLLCGFLVVPRQDRWPGKENPREASERLSKQAIDAMLISGTKSIYMR